MIAKNGIELNLFKYRGVIGSLVFLLKLSVNENRGEGRILVETRGEGRILIAETRGEGRRLICDTRGGGRTLISLESLEKSAKNRNFLTIS